MGPPDGLSEREPERGCCGSLLIIARDEGDRSAAREAGAIFDRNGKVECIQRSEPMLGHEPIRGRQNRLSSECQEHQRTGLAAVRIDSREQGTPAAEAARAGGAPDRAGELHSGNLADDHRLISFQKHGSEVNVISLVREICTDDGTGVGVEQAHRCARSVVSASLARVPTPRVNAMTASRDGGRIG